MATCAATHVQGLYPRYKSTFYLWQIIIMNRILHEDITHCKCFLLFQANSDWEMVCIKKDMVRDFRVNRKWYIIIINYCDCKNINVISKCLLWNIFLTTSIRYKVFWKISSQHFLKHSENGYWRSPYFLFKIKGAMVAIKRILPKLNCYWSNFFENLCMIGGEGFSDSWRLFFIFTTMKVVIVLIFLPTKIFPDETCCIVTSVTSINPTHAFQKQPSRRVLEKRCSKNMQQTYRRTPTLGEQKLQSNIIEITLRHGCSPVNLLHIFRASFLLLAFPTNYIKK